MILSGPRCFVGIMLLLGLYLGCTLPSTPQTPQLTLTAAQNTLDTWNPNYCKVVELYGFNKSGDNATEQIAYALIANPSDKGQKSQVYAARFQLLTMSGGKQQWFLVSLTTHSLGLSRRQGWDNLMIPVKEGAPAK